MLEVENLRVEYEGRNRPFRRRHSIRAVDGVSFTIAEGETLGLVGESGSGKSSVGNTVLGLRPATAGSIRFDRTDLTHADRYPPEIRRNIQAVFQNPGSSLDPSMLVNQILSEPLEIHERHARDGWHARIVEALELVGLSGDHIERSPHEFSGGQRQRIAIARSLILEPRLLVLDEAVSALDASTQSQIINLLRDLQGRLRLTFLFISHDLAVVHHISDRIAVMYAGTLVECGPADAVFEQPAHPYTRALLDAVPRLEPGRTSRRDPGVAPAAGADRRTVPPTGCPFQLRCPDVHDRCRASRPPAVVTASGTSVACFLSTDEPTARSTA